MNPTIITDTNPALAATRVARILDGDTRVSSSAEHSIDDDDAFECAKVAACVSFLCGDLDNSSDY